MSDEKTKDDTDLDEKEAAASDDAAETKAKTTEDEPAEATGADTSASESEEEDEEDEDVANPAAIARRVAALGADDQDEALAREEERKLAERRAAKKKGKKKGGLEAAASKKLSKIGKRAEPKRTVAVAADADPLIERTAKLSEWAKKNQKVVQLVGVVLCVGLLGVAGFLYYDHKRETEASAILTKAVEAQQSPIGEPPKATNEDEEENRQTYYKTFDDRRAAALKQYREVGSKFSGTGAAILARLAEGSLLLDKREADNAIAAFNEVKGSALASVDNEVKGRAIEGLGFAHELKATANPAEKDKELEAALASFKELESSVDVRGFKELAMYHQARVLQNKGDKDKAKELLLSLKERMNKSEDPVAPGLPPPASFPFLREMAMDRLHDIDPASAPKPTHGGGHGGPGNMQFTQEQIRKLMEDAQKKGGH